MVPHSAPPSTGDEEQQTSTKLESENLSSSTITTSRHRDNINEIRKSSSSRAEKYAKLSTCPGDERLNSRRRQFWIGWRQLLAMAPNSKQQQHGPSSSMSQLSASMVDIIQRTRKKYRRYEKPRQEISVLLKYCVFFINFVFLLMSVACLSLGLYLFFGYYRPLSHVLDLLLNPGLVLCWVGLLSVCVCCFGATGALRDNVCLLKTFSFLVFGSYICLVVCAFLVFILFYSRATDGVSVSSVLLLTLRNYHLNDNMRDFMDYIQRELSCCGVSSAGYKDWSLNAQYNCSDGNYLPEACAVPFSCCRYPRSIDDEHISPVEQSKLLSQMRSLVCWQGAQRKSLPELQSLINVDGCVQFVQKAFESQAVTIGAIVGALVIPVCLSVTCVNVLAKQIERQHYLLDRQARREERRRRRDRHRFRDPFATRYTPGARVAATDCVDETKPSTSLAPQNEVVVTDKRRVRRRRRAKSVPSYAEVDDGEDGSDVEQQQQRKSQPAGDGLRADGPDKSSGSGGSGGRRAEDRAKRRERRKQAANRARSVGDAVHRSRLVTAPRDDQENNPTQRDQS